MRNLHSYENKNQEWVFDAASQVMQLQEGGAFVKVLLRSLASIVDKTLARIIAFADINYNLSLIDPNSDSSEHLRFFWLSAFTCLFELDQMECIKEDNYKYQCQFPFSKHLQFAVQAILKIRQGIHSGNIMSFFL